MGETRTHPGQYVSVGRAAALLGISPRTMGRILEDGSVQYIRPRGREHGHRRVNLASLIKYRDGVSENGAPELPALAYDPLED